jgi:azurin
MRRKIFLLTLALLTFSGCDRSAAPAPPAQPTGPTIAEIPVSLNDKVQVVAITADDSMHFNGNRFTVKTGQPVRVELTNIGHKPKEEMAHNFVLLHPSVDTATFNLLSAQAKASNYLPPDQMDKVIAFTPLAGPGEMVNASFTAPIPGSYTFLCNYPGHFAAGMRGTMNVIP